MKCKQILLCWRGALLVFSLSSQESPPKKKLESQTTHFALANHEMCSLLSDITPRLPPQKYEHLFPLSPCSSDFSGWVCCYATLSVNWLIVFFHKPKHYLGSHHLERLVEFPWAYISCITRRYLTSAQGDSPIISSVCCSHRPKTSPQTQNTLCTCKHVNIDLDLDIYIYIVFSALANLFIYVESLHVLLFVFVSLIGLFRPWRPQFESQRFLVQERAAIWIFTCQNSLAQPYAP